MTIRSIRAVIFDLDGVILESTNIKTEAFAELFAEYPEHQSRIRDYHLDNLGISRFKKFEWIYQELLHKPISKEQIAELGEKFSAIVFDKVLRCPLVPGAAETLPSLKDRCLLFVASGTPQQELDQILQLRGLHSYFHKVLGAPLEKNEIIRSILKENGIGPDEVVFIGDGLSDYRAAKETGVRFIARDTPEMKERWPVYQVELISDLENLYVNLW